MKTEKVIWGLILVFIGGVLLLENFEIIEFYWDVVFRFWPLILIIIGANLLFPKEKSQVAALVCITLTVLALAFIAYQGTTPPVGENARWFYRFDDDENSRIDTDALRNTNFSEVYNQDINKAVLKISGGATQYKLSDTAGAENLFEADVKSGFGNYSLHSTVKDSTQNLNFKMMGKTKWNLKRSGSNIANLRLNSKPIWDINIEMGAGTTDFDLSPFKVNSVHIEGGAASFELKMGMPVDTTHINIETGASEIEILIPATASCIINTETGLSSSNFEGFTKQSDGSYTTPDFADTSKMIIINFEGGLSNFKVKRY